jgi:hypothetical protein
MLIIYTLLVLSEEFINFATISYLSLDVVPSKLETDRIFFPLKLVWTTGSGMIPTSKVNQVQRKFVSCH